MSTDQFTSGVETIPIDQIEPSPDNPRGSVEIDQSFERLVSSVREVGILVPIVVRKLGEQHYQLVDGERRFLAAKQLRVKRGIPAHVLTSNDLGELRKYMFHLHMTREQWEPLAQCKALAEMYPELEDGIPLKKKTEWVKKIKKETWMDERTARDRIHVLAWPAELKKKIMEFDSSHRDREIYSYILALEASIIEPHARASKHFEDDDGSVDEKANQMRAALLKKTLDGVEKGHITNRDQIRDLEPLFKAELSGEQSKVASRIVSSLVKQSEYLYDDATAEVEQRLPELVSDKPPKPQKLIGSIKTITKTIHEYDPSFIDLNAKGILKRKKLSAELRGALTQLLNAARKLRDRL
jgi:hypothetical protein